MAELTLRTSQELYGRIQRLCATHGLSMADFCRKAAKQYYSGKLKPVIEHELLQATTYQGGVIQSWKWEFELNGRELLAVLVATVLKLEKIKPEKPPKCDLVEGVDYNMPENEVIRRFYAGKI